MNLQKNLWYLHNLGLLPEYYNVTVLKDQGRIWIKGQKWLVCISGDQAGIRVQRTRLDNALHQDYITNAPCEIAISQLYRLI